MKSIITSGIEAYDRTDLRNSFHVAKKEGDAESDATEAPSTVWMETIRGKTADALEVARIQADRKVVVSDI